MPLDPAFQRNGYQTTDGRAYNVTDSGNLMELVPASMTA
jgi:hypothetical protein